MRELCESKEEALGDRRSENIKSKNVLGVKDNCVAMGQAVRH